MIGKAKAITHGITALKYASGESEHKKHPEKIYHVMNCRMPQHLDTWGIWTEMKLHLSNYKPIKNSVIRLELSPAKEHTKNFTMKDWEDLWLDFIHEFDRQQIYDDNHKLISGMTDLIDTMGAVWLHRESDGDVPHLHGIYCRRDMDGETNNDHMINLRANRAAEKVAIKRGWTTASQIHYRKVTAIRKDCIDVLRSMSRWSWDGYVAGLTAKGYKVNATADSKGEIHGYSISIGNSRYKASELGVGRNLLKKRLEETWKKEQGKAGRVARPVSIIRPVAKPVPEQRPVVIEKPAARKVFDYTSWKPDRESYTLNVDGIERKLYIPTAVMEHFDDVFDSKKIDNWDDLTSMSVRLFTGVLLPDTSEQISAGGGGSQSELPWRDDDDDDLEWARRCALEATRYIKPKKKRGMRLH